MTVNWFTSFETTEDIKNEYHRLCKIHHPDLGGDTATMQEINTHYAIASANAIRMEKPDWTEEQYVKADTVAEVVREAIERIITIPGLEIEVCGVWVWVGGDTKPNGKTLSDAGYKWASKKKKWYFPGIPAGGFGWSMEKIRAYYGSQKIRSGTRKEEKEKEVPAFA